ncbi:MAG: transglycosylase domain-containing protein [Polyangiaceae bacterium]|nr:transglycosylase domain-containing protein [Polyangiaceae bacterium]
MSRRHRLVAIPLVLILVAILAAIAFPRLVRREAESRAERLGLAIAIDSVYPFAFGIELSGVEISSPDMPSLSFRAESVLVGMSFGGVSSVTIDGGGAVIRSDYKAFVREIEQWRAKRVRGSGGSSRSSAISMLVRGVSLDWDGFDGPGSSLSAAGVAFADSVDRRFVEADSFVVRHPMGGISGKRVGVEVAADSRYRVRSIRAEHLAAEVQKWGGSEDASAELGGSASGKTGRDLRAGIAKIASVLWSPMDSDGVVEVGAFEVLVHHLGQQINVGPGILSVRNSDGAVLVDLAPRVDAGKVGITFRGAIPLSGGDIVFDVVGGPISLAALGVKEGNMGLVGVDDAQVTSDAHITLHGDGERFSFNGTFVAKNLGVSHRKVASIPVLGLGLAARLRGTMTLDRRAVTIEDGQIDVGKVQFQLSGTVDRSNDRLRVDVRFGIPLVSCQSVLDALPVSLAPVVHGMEAVGTLSLDGELRFDESKPGDFRFKYDSNGDCRFTSVPAFVDVRKFRGPFKRMAYDQRGQPVEVETGPGTRGWTYREGISHFVNAAVMTCEDGRFYRHRGFDHEAIHNSVRDNLREGKFLRGASTISMQLAKNLYLGQEKTVSRKLQELILTTYLEQVLTKNQIMELYLNIVELGPMTFGFGNGAWLYFNKPASDLSLSQAMYLASVLPAPSRQHFGKDGKVTDGWMRYLYKLMRVSAKMRWVSDVELDAGLAEWVVRGSVEPIRLVPEGANEESSGVVDSFGWGE